MRSKDWNIFFEPKNCLRHSAITFDADYLPEFGVKKKARWSMNSRQGSRYIKSRMGGDLKRAILLQNGIVVGEDDALRPKPAVRDCPRCNLINSFENKYCSKCSYPLVPSAFEEIKKDEESKIQHMVQEHFQELRETTQAKDEEIRSLKDDVNSMRDDMNNIYEVLRIAKRNKGRLGKDRTMLDEEGRISFCQTYENGQQEIVKIPIDAVEIAEDSIKQDHK